MQSDGTPSKLHSPFLQHKANRAASSACAFVFTWVSCHRCHCIRVHSARPVCPLCCTEAISQAVMQQTQMFLEDDALLLAASRLPASPQKRRASLMTAAVGGFAQIMLTNSPIPPSPGKRSLLSKRVSIGVGDSCHIRPSIFEDKMRSEHGRNLDMFMRSPTKLEPMSNHRFDAFWGDQDMMNGKISSAEPGCLMKEVFLGSPKKMDNCGSGQDGFCQQKRRLSAMMISPNIFNDQEGKFTRRDSLSSVESFASETEVGDRDGDQHAHTGQTSIVSEPTLPCLQPANVSPFSTFLVAHQPLIPMAEAKGIMENFTSAMTQSMQTQQAIHDWDKKMGLKRSHSKTMRLSMRSRKKLKTLIKKDIHAMSECS